MPPLTMSWADTRIGEAGRGGAGCPHLRPHVDLVLECGEARRGEVLRVDAEEVEERRYFEVGHVEEGVEEVVMHDDERRVPESGSLDLATGAADRTHDGGCGANLSGVVGGLVVDEVDAGVGRVRGDPR